MKKLLLIGAATLIVSNSTFAGGILTNTNQHASFLRMIARGASIDIDGVYSNPAGLAFLPKDGFYLSLTGQSAYQERNITSISPLFITSNTPTGERFYQGDAAAPIVPSFHFAYKKDKWTISSSFAITGGGGKASFDNGLPMFDAAAIGLISSLSQGALTTDMYDINSAMEGRQYIYGLQLGLTYKINEHISVFAGGRMNYFSGGYKGYLNIDLKEGAMKQAGAKLVEIYTKQFVQNGMPYDQAVQQATQAVQAAAPAMANKLENSQIELDCDQTGWGLTPIIGIDAKLGCLNLAAKYEFMTNMNIENKTHKFERPEEAADVMAPYAHGVNTPSDIPALLSLAAGYEFLPTLRGSVEWHFYDDKGAGMADGKQKHLKRGTFEYLAGVEWDVTKRVTLSGGYQRTDYGLSDQFQTDTSFYCDSYSLGFGAKIKLNEKLALNAAYFWTNYDDYTVESGNYKGITGVQGKDVYSRTNKVFGVSLDYHF